MAAVIETLPELRNNPFREQILGHFGVRTGTQATSPLAFDFDHFLEMASCFSPNAPVECKVALAFAIYGLTLPSTTIR